MDRTEDHRDSKAEVRFFVLVLWLGFPFRRGGAYVETLGGHVGSSYSTEPGVGYGNGQCDSVQGHVARCLEGKAISWFVESSGEVRETPRWRHVAWGIWEGHVGFEDRQFRRHWL